MNTKHKKRIRNSGQLRIGDMWNAITIIALSQNNPLKAIAEFVENSIDAGAHNITVIRGREHGAQYIKVHDDGGGIPKDENGAPDFAYVATHICDSIKREMKERGATGIQGEFGIGLLSFWTVGQKLTLSCSGTDGVLYQMRLVKDAPGYTVTRHHTLISENGTELTVSPLLPGLRQLNGEKIQWYLAAELRDRIRNSNVKIRVIDRQARKEFNVEPRRFTGRLLHNLPAINTEFGDAYVELYLTEPEIAGQVALCRSGTRVLESISTLDRFSRAPWASSRIEGLVDAAFLHLTPGTRDGIIQDEAFAAFCNAMVAIETELQQQLNEQREAEEQRATKEILKSVQKALREALQNLPVEEYDWFDIHSNRSRAKQAEKIETGIEGENKEEHANSSDTTEEGTLKPIQKQFFECEGPLFAVRVSPASCIIPVGGKRNLRALARDRSGRRVERDLKFAWQIVEGDGQIVNPEGEIIDFSASSDPCLVRVEVMARQNEVTCNGEGLITVTDSLAQETTRIGVEMHKGLPGYTFHRAPGELWRSKYDQVQNLVVINNGHRDFVYSSRNRSRKLRYICRLFSKELLLHNFPGIPVTEALERLIELSLYTEDNLK